MKIAPQLIGVNNRDLKTFTVDLGTTERIAKLVPEDSDPGCRKRDEIR